MTFGTTRALAARSMVALALVAVAGLAHAQFKCIDAKGAVSIQQMPCPQDQKETQLDTRYESAPTPSAAAAPKRAAQSAAVGRTGLAPSGRPCKSAAEYEEIKRELAKNKKKPAADVDPAMASLAGSLFGGLDKKLEDEMKACL